MFMQCLEQVLGPNLHVSPQSDSAVDEILPQDREFTAASKPDFFFEWQKAYIMYHVLQERDQN